MFSLRRNLSLRGAVTFLDPPGGSYPSTPQSRGKSIGNSHFHIQEVLISIQLRSHNIREAIHNTRVAVHISMEVDNIRLLMWRPTLADKVDRQVELGRGNYIIKGIWEAGWEDSRPTVVSALNNITIKDAQNKPDLIIGMLNILAHLARMLIDLGATHLVIFVCSKDPTVLHFYWV